MNILITPYCADTVLIELARCMALMKNLHTVQISSFSGVIRLPKASRSHTIRISELYKAAFAGSRFPSVHRIAFNSPSQIGLLPCFPEARWVYMALVSRPFRWEARWKTWVLGHLKKLPSHCPKVQVFKWNAEPYRPWAIADGKSHLQLHDSIATGIRDTQHTAESSPSTDIHKA